MRRAGSCVLFTSLIVFCSAAVIYFTVNHAIKRGLYQQLIISPHAARFADWIDIKGDQMVEFWLWNVTNPREIRGDLKKDPKLEQVGPFTYKVTRHKHNVVFKENSSAVSYEERFELQFNRSLSVADETTNLSVFNFAALSILSQVDNFPAVVRNLMAVAIIAFEQDKGTGSFVVMNRDVKSILFGYKDPFLKLIKESIPFFSDIDDKIVLVPNPFEDQLEVSTGADGVKYPQTVLKWKNQETLNFYGDKYCNMINGTDCTLFKTPLKKRMHVFLSDLCRSVEIEQEGYSGKTLVNYRLSDRTQENSSVNPDNACFDKFGRALFALPCQSSSSVVFSNPHFLGADQKYVKISEGMNPDDSEHITRLSIHRLSGVPIIVQKKLQVNFLSPKHADLTSQFRTDTLYPVVWMNQSYRGREEDVSLLWRRVNVPKMACDYTSLCLACIAALLIVIGVALVLIPRRSSGEEEEVPEASENSPLLHNAF